MDVLSEILESVRLRCFVSGRSELTAPWGIRMPRSLDEIPEHMRPPPPPELAHLPRERLPPPPPPGGGFYAILRGACVLELDGSTPPVPLAGGDLVVLSQEGGHQIRDSLASPVRPIWEVHSHEDFRSRRGVTFGGGGAPTSFIFGGFFFEDRAHNHVLAALPPLIHLKGAKGQAAPWLEHTLRLMTHETGTFEAGAQTVINHLAHVLFVQAVRAHVASLSPASGNWLRALLDADIGPALGHIHARPGEPWTVASLAQSVAMSRTAFAERFVAMVGQSPLRYLTQHRMHKAAGLLGEGRLPLKEIAARVGYESEAAFSNAFKRTYGMAPGAYRKQEGLYRPGPR